MKKIVLKHYGIRDFFVTRKTKYREARQVYSWLKYYYSDDTVTQIAKDINKDHSTVSIAVKTTNERIQTSYSFSMFVRSLVDEINLPLLYPKGRYSLKRTTLPYPTFKEKMDANSLPIEFKSAQHKTARFMELSRELATWKRRNLSAVSFSDLIDSELKIKSILQEIKELY